MNSEKVLQDLIEILSHISECGTEIELEASIYNDIGLSSIELIDLVIEVEKKFGIECPDEMLSKDLSVVELRDWICESVGS